MDPDLADRARVASLAWLATLPEGIAKTIPDPPRERIVDDDVTILTDPAPAPHSYRGGGSVWDTTGEYTLRASGYVPDGLTVTEEQLADDGADPVSIHDLGAAARRKEQHRAPRARTRIKVGHLPDLSSLAKLEPANQWAGELVTELLTRKLRDGRLARLPDCTGPEYISRGVLGWAMRAVAPRGGNTRLGPLTLARVLADPVALAAHLDDRHARRQVQMMCPPLMDEGAVSAAG